MTFLARAYKDDEQQYVVVSADSRDEAVEQICKELGISSANIVWLRLLLDGETFVF